MARVSACQVSSRTDSALATARCLVLTRRRRASVSGCARDSVVHNRVPEMAIANALDSVPEGSHTDFRRRWERPRYR